MLRDEFPHLLPKKVDGEFGIEIEVETLEPYDYPQHVLEYHDGLYKLTGLPKWKAKTDDSLRNFGTEFVLKNPLSKKLALKALDDWGLAFKDVPFLKDTVSTSVHIHRNMMNEEITTLAKVLTTWVLVENLMVEFAGPNRRSNMFALPVRCAEGNITNMTYLFDRIKKHDANAIKVNINYAKYGAVNLCCLATLGSLEFRCHRGTSDVEQIKKWIQILDRIILFARDSVSIPPNILDIYKELGPDILHLIFEDTAKYLFDVVPLAHTKPYLDRNLWYAGAVADCIKETEWYNLNTAMTSYMGSLTKKDKEANPWMTGLTLSNPVPPVTYEVSVESYAEQPEQPALDWLDGLEEEVGI